MECAGVREKLSCYLDVEMDERALELVEAHLAGCPECRRELDLLRAIVHASAALEQLEAPLGLKSAILKAAYRTDRCKPIMDLLSAYVDGELSASERQTVAAHLDECSYCAEETESLKRLASAASEVTPMEPPEDLRSRIRAATAGSGITPRPARSLIARLWQTAGLRWAGGAVAVAAAAGIVLAVMLPVPEPPRPGGPISLEPRAPRIAIERAPSQPPILVKPVPVNPTVETAVVARPRRIRVSMKPPAGPAVEKPKLNVARPARTTSGGVEEPKPEPVEVAVSPSLETRGREPEERSDAPKPAPVIKSDEHRPVRSAPIKVASAPAADSDDMVSFIEQVKASAAMRRSGGSGGIQLFSTKF